MEIEGVIFWPEVCGENSRRDAFWDDNLTVNTNNPDLTDCFQRTVLVWTPCAYLWIASVFYLSYLIARTKTRSCVQKSKFNVFKIVCSLLLAAVSIAELIYTSVGEKSTVQIVAIISPAVSAVTYLLAAYIIHYEFSKGIHSSGVIFCFWLFKTVVDIVPFRSKILKAQAAAQVQDLFHFVVFYVSYALILILFISGFKADLSALYLSEQKYRSEEETPLLFESPTSKGSKERERPCPEKESTWLSNITYAWITPLIFKGYKKPLQFHQLYDLMDDDKSDAVVRRMEHHWANQLSKSKEPSLLWVLCLSCGFPMFAGSFIKLLGMVLDFVNPMLLQLVISFVENPDEKYMWKGYMFAVLLLVNNIVRAITTHFYFKVSTVTGQRFRMAVTTSVYRKILRLSSAARRNITVGEITNLMSVDAQKLQDSAFFFQSAWTTPLYVILCMVFMWQQVGPSCFAGLAVMLLVLPVNGVYFGRKLSILQRSQMQEKDVRVKLLNEILAGIKVLKLYAWEKSFLEKIRDCRGIELNYVKISAYLQAVNNMLLYCTPYLVSLATFAVFVVSSPSNVLDPQKAFVTISLINLLNFPVATLPLFVAFFAQAMVSTKRISKLLLEEEIDPDAVQFVHMADKAVKVEDGVFSWGKEEAPMLKDINFSVDEGSLIAVVGQVGAGKSSLVSSLLGELYKLQGKVTIKGNIAYVPQQAWIQNATLQQNITFGKSLHLSQYNKIIDACAMRPDLSVLPGGDQTEIGEKGINLSGGQKQRISLARAVYQNEDIYLLDDPLSAVDAHVGKHIFEQVIGPTGVLKKKTRILVTHGVTYLPKVDKILVMKNGRISEAGTYNELLDSQGAFAEFIQTYLEESPLDSDTDAEEANIKRELLRRISSTQIKNTDSEESDGQSSARRVSGGTKQLRQRKISRSLSATVSKDDTRDKDTVKGPGKLIEEESAATGSIKLAVLKMFLHAAGYTRSILVLVFLLGFLGAQIGTNLWLSIWSSDQAINGTQDRALVNLRLGVYGAFGAGQAAAVLLVSIFIAMGCWTASKVVHDSLLQQILRAPMAFFDTTPLGRMLNRFAKDMDIIDINIPIWLRLWLFNLVPVIATLIIICYSTPLFLVVVVPLAIIYILVQKVYIAGVRQLKRMDSILRSPIYVHFDETIGGATSIRAYRQQDRFIDKSDLLVNNSQIAWYNIIIAQRWIGVVLDGMAAFVVFFASTFAVLSDIGGGLVGLSVSYALQVTAALSMVVRSATELETYIVAIERIHEYTNIAQEAAWIVPGNRPARDWPDRGIITLNNYSTRYRPELDLVLKGVNLEIKQGEMVGIVGRTGAGKSSLTLSLFRIIEAVGGNITIDGQNISHIGLHDLRGKLTIIPQDPVVFSGSLRDNLDPFKRYTDAEIWTALGQAHLKSFVSELREGLQYECGEGGEALSVGQRQLVCLARALLRHSKILILDEATAAVDLETDDLIQTTIRTQFKDCTVVTIAHRLNTIMDYDRVLVLDQGTIKEFDSPERLLQDKQSVFYSMAKDAGLV